MTLLYHQVSLLSTPIQYEKIKNRLIQGGELTHKVINHIFEERYFGSYSQNHRKLLVKLSLLNSFSFDFIVNLYDGNGTDLEYLKRNVFLFEESIGNRYYIHNMYRIFLQSKKYILSDDEKTAVWQQAALYHLNSGDILEAVECFRKCGDHGNMLDTIFNSAISVFGISEQTAELYLEYFDLLTPEELQKNPLVECCKALIYTCTYQLEQAEPLLIKLEQDLSRIATPDAMSILGEVYIVHGLVSMMRADESFGDHFKKAVDLLPNGSKLSKTNDMKVCNNYSFFMPDNLPGTKDRIERAIHYGVPWMARAMNGGINGMEHVFSAEMAYLSFKLESAQQHAYRAIYKAKKTEQYDLICNSYFILARTAYLQGNFKEMRKHIDSIVAYAEKYEIGVLKEIRDTALTWYYIKLQDYAKIPKYIFSIDYSNNDGPTYNNRLTYMRLLIAYSNYLISTGENSKVVALLDFPYIYDAITQDYLAGYILRAIGYYNLGDFTTAIDMLWQAYDLSYNNGLTALFIEAEKPMISLIDAARRQNGYNFDPKWMDYIEEQSRIATKHAVAIRKDYRIMNTVKANDNPLTKKELDILQALSRGMKREEIASERYISINTVKTYIRSIYNKLGTSNRAEAISIAISRGYITGINEP